MHPSTTSPLMTVRQAADDIQVARKTIYDWIHKGLLPAGKLPGGSELRIRRTDWITFVESLFGESVPVSANDDATPDHDVAEATPCHSGRRRTAPRDFFAVGGGIDERLIIAA